jgi:hypothetical protein
LETFKHKLCAIAVLFRAAVPCCPGSSWCSCGAFAHGMSMNGSAAAMQQCIEPWTQLILGLQILEWTPRSEPQVNGEPKPSFCLVPRPHRHRYRHSYLAISRGFKSREVIMTLTGGCLIKGRGISILISPIRAILRCSKRLSVRLHQATESP